MSIKIHASCNIECYEPMKVTQRNLQASVVAADYSTYTFKSDKKWKPKINETE